MEKSWFVMSSRLERINFEGDTDIRYTKEFVKRFILRFTKKGDRILDPFAGFGTTLLVAQKLKRQAIGIEYDRRKYEYVKRRLKDPSQIIWGDSLRIGTYRLPKFDFSITSPPYMRYFDEENPFTNYTEPGGYAQYLKDIRGIYRQIKRIMKKGATVVIEVSNTVDKKRPMTPLAWDIGREIAKIFFFEQEIIYCSKEGDHSHVLVFKNR